MPLNIDGADRSRSLACLPTARNTVASTRGQVPGGVLLGTSLVPYKVITWSRWLVGSWGGLGGPGPALRANFRTRGPERVGRRLEAFVEAFQKFAGFCRGPPAG